MKNTDELKPYDYLIVGAGLYGATFAYKAKQQGKKCLVIDKRSHTGGNVYCENTENINVHKYGAHIFHTSNKKVWDFVNSIADFNHYINSPIANYKGKLYNLPFNMNTFYALWGVKTPEEAKAKIERQRKESGITEPENLEEQAIALVGKDIYEILIKGYTEKQWGRKCTELPTFIIKRLPVRFTFNNNYFNDIYQGIPIGGYNKLINGLLSGIETRCRTDFFENREYFENIADKIVFTGKIDEFYNYRFGNLEYRSLRFETEILDCDNFQGNAVVNYTEREIPYTRIIEHKHFEFGVQPKTVISKEYSSEWKKGGEPFYPVNDEKNNMLYQQYKNLADKESYVVFGGRLAEYKYYDMDRIIEQILSSSDFVLLKNDI
jgi:UDP-galactopyranose mutase